MADLSYRGQGTDICALPWFALQTCTQSFLGLFKDRLHDMHVLAIPSLSYG